MPDKNQKDSLRIIGGKWKRHAIRFEGSHDLRPTPDAVRETLFNWLTPAVQGANCLDLFSGSGALGFEAASRGACQVHLVEHNYAVYKQLLRTRDNLSAEQIHVHYQDGLSFLENCAGRFDIVFLDPPFQSTLSKHVLSMLEHSNTLIKEALVYLERPKNGNPLILSKAWKISREKTTGSSIYGLYKLDKTSNSRL
jgi:16S rRNA (guanine966-N2)-methyltransferase